MIQTDIARGDCHLASGNLLQSLIHGGSNVIQIAVFVGVGGSAVHVEAPADGGDVPLRHRLLDRNLSRLPLERDAVREETLKVAASLGDAQLVATLQAFYPAFSPIAARLKEPPDVLALYREVQSRGPESTINQRLEWAERLLELVQAQDSERPAEDTLRGYQRLEDLLASGQTLPHAMDIVAHELFNLNGLLGGSADYERAPATIQELASHLTIGGSRIKKRQEGAALE